jgi:RNA polymerase sigma-70 factor, ECF subfamily
MDDGEQLPDGETVELAKSDPNAFGILYERFVGKIYNYIYYRVGDHHDAEDLTARTFQRALANISTFESRGVPVSAWFYRIAHNLVANWHRDRSRRQTIPLDSLVDQRSPLDSPQQMAERDEQCQALLRALRRLPDERQQLIVLKFADHLSNAEIGEVMGRTESAVKSLYHRTLLSLRRELVKQGYTSDDGD